MNYKLKMYRGRYIAYLYENGETIRKSLGTTDKDEAQRRFEDFKSTLQGDAEFINGILDRWTIEKSNIASIETSTMIIKKHLKPFFGALRPNQINKKLCREYIELKRKSLSDWSIRRHITILRGAIILNDKYTPAIFEMPPEGSPRDYTLSREDFLKALDATTSPHVKLFLILALTTAGRMGAILDLTWDRVDFDKGIIKLAVGEHKIKGRAIVPINKRCREALMEAFPMRTTNNVIEYNGNPVKSVKKSLRRIAKKTGLKITAHVLRHTAAVWMVQARIPLETVSKYLGHTSTKITYKFYAHHSPDYLTEAADALEF